MTRVSLRVKSDGREDIRSRFAAVRPNSHRGRRRRRRPTSLDRRERVRGFGQERVGRVVGGRRGFGVGAVYVQARVHEPSAGLFHRPVRRELLLLDVHLQNGPNQTTAQRYRAVIDERQ